MVKRWKTGMTDTGKQRIIAIWFLIAVLFSWYAAMFIYKTSFVYDGERYFCLFDDAMISMRYAKNLVSGHGLVMNPGERVEGFTNPLWVLYMALFHLFPIPAAKMSLPIQISGAVLLLLTMFWTMKIADLIGGRRFGVTLGTMVLTIGYLPLINWSLIGMEVSLLVLLTVIIVWQALVCLRERSCSWLLYVILGIGTLVRLDFAAVAVSCTVYLALMIPEHKKRHLAAGIISLTVFIGIQTLFRLWYYHELLPMTYYLKMTGYPVLWRIIRGVTVFFQFAWQMYLIPLVLPLLLFIRKPARYSGLLVTVFCMQCLYSIYVGGDAWEYWRGSNRYIAVVMPLLFVLLSMALAEVGDMLTGKLRFNRSPMVERILENTIRVILVLTAFMLVNRNERPISYANYLFYDQTVNHDLNAEMVEIADTIRQITTPDASIAVIRAGALPYFSERYTVDILGKTDPVIAQMEMRQAAGNERYTYFYPGHLKYDYKHSVGDEEPDIITDFWGNIDEATLYVTGSYVKLVPGTYFLYIRRESPRIRWDMLPPLDK